MRVSSVGDDSELRKITKIPPILVRRQPLATKENEEYVRVKTKQQSLAFERVLRDIAVMNRPVSQAEKALSTKQLDFFHCEGWTILPACVVDNSKKKLPKTAQKAQSMFESGKTSKSAISKSAFSSLVKGKSRKRIFILGSFRKPVSPQTCKQGNWFQKTISAFKKERGRFKSVHITFQAESLGSCCY